MKLKNILTDREVERFIGVKNVRAVAAKFLDKPTMQSSPGGWLVSELCEVYGLSEHGAAERLQKFIQAGRIAGPLLF